MIVEVQSKLNRDEYVKAALKISYKPAITRLFVVAGVISLVLLLLQWFGIKAIFDTDLPYFPFFLVLFNIFLPYMIMGGLQKQFDSSLGLQRDVTYIFDEEKIHYFAEGCDVTLSWEYLVKYDMINNFLVLYISSAAAYYIKTDTLKPDEIAFIQSKITQPGM